MAVDHDPGRGTETGAHGAATDVARKRASVSVHAAALVALGAARWPPPVTLVGGVVGAVLAAGVVRAARSRAGSRGPERRGLVLAGLVVLAAVIGVRHHQAGEGLEGVVAGPVEARVTLLDDPRPLDPGVAVTVVAGSRHLAATAYGPAAWDILDRSAGETIDVRGRVRPLRDDDPLRWRHVAGRLTVDEVTGAGPADPLHRAANALRSVLLDGARVLGPERAPLFGGMVIGDDRGQSPVTADDFRAAGLGHLLVVSGQNVVFVLALVAPLTRRLRPGSRLVAVVAVLAVFCVVTRFEPSVLRAVTMAGFSTAAGVLGTRTDARRTLSSSIVVLCVVDPFLVRVLAFQLSAAASAGIVWLGPALERRLGGPAPVRGALAATGGAQLAVAPLLVATFGSVPVWSLPANLLADPAAGPVMMWGATAGLVAGVAPAGVARLVHLPTRALLGWITGVAHLAAVAPPAKLGGVGLALLAGAIVVAMRWRRVGAALVVLVGVVTVLTTPRPAGGELVLDGVRVWRGGGAVVVVLEDPGRPARVLAALREAGVGRPGLVVAARGGRRDAAVVGALRDRFGPVPVLAPARHRVPGAAVAVTGERLRVGGVVVEVVTVDPDRLLVERIPATSGPPTADGPVEAPRGRGWSGKAG